MTDEQATQPAAEKVCRPRNILNRAQVKALALEIARQTRAQGFTRVGRSFVDRIEVKLRASIAYEVTHHPSVGKTLK